MTHDEVLRDQLWGVFKLLEMANVQAVNTKRQVALLANTDPSEGGDVDLKMAPKGQESTADDPGLSGDVQGDEEAREQVASTLRTGISESTVQDGSPWPTDDETRDHPALDLDEPRLTCPHCQSPLATASDVPGKLICTECGSSFRVESPRGSVKGDGTNWLGRFRLLQRVGQGTFGVVWRAFDTQLHRSVALKIPHPNAFETADFQGRFWREAQAAAALRHPGIVPVHEVITEGAATAIVSDYKDVDLACLASGGTAPLSAEDEHYIHLRHLPEGRIPALSLDVQLPIRSAAIDSEGKVIATAHDDGTARIWDASSGEPIAKPLIHPKPVHIIKLSQDGKTLATASRDLKVRLWNPATGEPSGKPLALESAITALQGSPATDSVLVGTAEGTVGVWDTSSGEFKKQRRHSANVATPRFGGDETTVVSGSWDHTACIHLVGSDGKERDIYLKHGDRVTTLSVSPEGKSILTACADHSIHFWDAATGQSSGAPVKR